MLSAFYVCCIYLNAHQATFDLGSKHYEPWSDCSEQSDLCPYCLQYRIPKCINRWVSRRQSMWMAGKWSNELWYALQANCESSDNWASARSAFQCFLSERKHLPKCLQVLAIQFDRCIARKSKMATKTIMGFCEGLCTQYFQNQFSVRVHISLCGYMKWNNLNWR